MDDAKRVAAGTAARVLLVDDEALVREVLATQLEDFSYEVLVAGNGREALALLAAGERVDALVTDLSMAEMDGLSLIRAAQAQRPGLPAVLLTGYAGDGTALAMTGAISGSYTLLRKPVSGEHLADRVAALLETNRACGERGKQSAVHFCAATSMLSLIRSSERPVLSSRA